MPSLRALGASVEGPVSEGLTPGEPPIYHAAPPGQPRAESLRGQLWQFLGSARSRYYARLVKTLLRTRTLITHHAPTTPNASPRLSTRPVVTVPRTRSAMYLTGNTM